MAINQHPYVEAKGLLNDDVANLAKVGTSRAACLGASWLSAWVLAVADAE